MYSGSVALIVIRVVNIIQEIPRNIKYKEKSLSQRTECTQLDL